MSLIIFGGPYQTYPNPGLPFQLNNGANGSDAVVTWNTTTLQPETGVQAYGAPTNGVSGVLLIPDISVFPYSTQPGVGGVITVLTFTPFGSLDGAPVTEEMLVGSFAWWNPAVNDLTLLYNYATGTNNQSDIDAFNTIDLAMVGLLQGNQPSSAVASMNAAVSSTGDATFAEFADALVQVAQKWDSPLYMLNGNYYSTDPAGFGVDLLNINSAETTWKVSGSQGGVDVSGFTAYSTYDLQTNIAQINIVSADTNGSVEVTALGGSNSARNDFNGDGKSDQIFQNGSTFTEWQSTGNSFTQNVYFNSLGAGWSLAGIGDFNGDGKSDLIFQNGGTFTEWQSTGNSFTPNVSVFSVGAGWNLAGVGDFNGDGKSDLIFQNGGTFTEWQSTGNSFTPNVYVNTVGAGWSLAGVGDFNGDGLSDLIFQNSGTFTEWQSTGNGFTPNVYVNTVGAGWTLVGVGDFNGDGKSDLIFQNGGTFTEWQSTGNSFTPNVVVDTLGAGWSVAAIGDFNGDGLSDILFRNTNGTFTEWQSTGSGFTQNVVVNSMVGNAWTLEYSPTGASGTPGAPAGLAASTTNLSASSSSIGEGGLITTDPTIGMLNQQSSLLANPPQLFGSHPA